jgi:quercetin dioxygenase-like cupin family protein
VDKGSFSKPAKTVDLSGMGTVEFVDVGNLKVSRLTFRPGWRWSEHAKPIVGGDSCQTHHYGFVTAGHLVVRMNDGSQDEFGPGDVWIIPSFDRVTPGIGTEASGLRHPRGIL